MKRFLFALALLTLALPARAATSYGVTFDTETSLIAVSVTPSAPTRIFTRTTAGITKRVVINNTPFNLYLSTYSVTFTTNPPTTAGTTTPQFYIPPTTSLTLDGSGSPYLGDLWGVLAATSTTGTTATVSDVGRVGVR